MSDAEYDTPKGRYIFFGLAFIALIVVGVWTVMVPALEDAPSEETPETAIEDPDDDPGEDAVEQDGP